MRATRSNLVLLVAVFLAHACAVDADPSAAEDTPAFEEGKADGQTVLDPCRSYPDRLRLMQMVKEAHPYPFAGTAMAWPDGRDGFITQTDWQLQSGRATRSASAGTLWGWWPNVNYTLTAWQLIVLQRRGELRNVHAVAYLDGGRFDPSPAAVRAIEAYYDELEATRDGVESGRIPQSEYGSRQSRLQQLLWSLHSIALADGLARNEDVLAQLPWAERRFSRAWGYSVVDILATLNFPTDGAKIEPLNELLLPRRTVNGWDLNPVASSDLPATQRAGVMALVALDEFERRTDKLVYRTVRDFVTSAERAARAVELVLEVFRTGDVLQFVRAMGG